MQEEWKQMPVYDAEALDDKIETLIDKCVTKIFKV